MAKIITQLDLYRDTNSPLQGYRGNPWNYAGSCVTAQAAVIRGEALEGLNIDVAFWRICWKPNITNGAQTAVRLISSDYGPTNIVQVAATYSGGKPNSPLNENFDITDAFNALIASHLPNTPFEFLHQSCGDGTYGCLIYSSSLELVLHT